MGRPANFDINAAHPLARGLVFAGLGNSPRGNIYFDSSSRRNHGVNINILSNSYQYIGKLGRIAVIFDGTNDRYIRIQQNQSFNFTAFSLSFWFNITDTPLIQEYLIGHLGTAGAFRNGWCVRIHNSDTTQITFGGGNLAENTWQLHTSYTQNIWTHMCCINTGNIAKLYVNRNFVSQDTTATFTIPTFPLIIAGRTDAPSSNTPPIKLSDIIIHNRVLSFDEIKILANKHDYTLGGLIV